MRAGFSLNHYVNQPRVRHWIDFYARNGDMLHHDFLRAKPFLWRIVQMLHKRDMPTELALLPEVESDYNPFAVSDSSRATGLWQFMPVTARRFDLRHDWWYDGRRSILGSTNAALTYLKYLHQMFHGSWLLALAAYNSGEGTVQAAIRRNVRRGRPADFWHLDLPEQTEQYVPQLLALAALVDRPSHYGIELPKIPAKPEVKVVKLKGQIDMTLAAKLADIPLHTLRDLNPGFRRWATAPEGPHRLLLPRHSVARFKRRLASIPSARRVTWHHYVIHPGDTLGEIAERYNTTPGIIRRINHLHGSLIRAGHSLLIPESEKNLSATRLATISEHAAHPSQPHPHGITQYTVRSGDSLWRIAHRTHTSVAALRRWNHLKANSRIQPGEKLVLNTPPRGTNSAEHGHYTVQHGDSLWQIAHRYNVSIKRLRHWNNLSPDSKIKPGETLVLDRQSPHPASQHAASPKKPNHYTVQHGDSLWQIAHRYSVSLNRLRHLNSLSPGSKIKPGETLVLDRQSPHRASQHAASPKKPNHYTVQHGDSLWQIAHRYNVSIKRLRHWNNLSADSKIKPGETLVLDRQSPHRASQHAASPKKPAHYTVQHGDSLWQIAHRYNVSVKKLKRWNNISHDASIHPGQHLDIPRKKGQVEYRVQKGDSLWTIAHRYGVSVSDLKQWNNLSGPHSLKPGTQLEIQLASDTGDGGGSS